MTLICRQIINQLLGIGINVSGACTCECVWRSCACADSASESMSRSLTAVASCRCVALLRPLQYAKLSQLTHSSRIHFDADEQKALVAALHFIFLHAAKYDVDGVSVLPSELQQLGLPSDICSAICRAFHAAKEALRTRLAANVLSSQSTGVAERRGRRDATALDRTAAWQ
jgi:hypothetical protein